MRRLIFHACDWELNAVIENLPKIHNLGFNFIQISPITPVKQEGTENWIKYQPVSFNIQKDIRILLKKLCTEADKFGIKIVVDIVIRHLAGDNNGNLMPHELCDKEIVNRPDFWLPPIPGYNAHNRDECINRCWGMPSLNYYNEELQQIYIKFLDELIELGVYSFRLDMCKHYALPEEGCSFFTNVIGRYSDRFNYGECIDLEYYWLKKYSKYIAVLTEQMFDEDDKLVTWIESHDTFHTFKTTCKMSNDMRLNEWRILLSKHKNCLWFSRPYDSIYENEYWYNRLREINISFNEK